MLNDEILNYKLLERPADLDLYYTLSLLVGTHVCCLLITLDQDQAKFRLNIRPDLDLNC